MEENGFHQPENQFPPARISSVFKNWFPLIALTVSASTKNQSNKKQVKNGLYLPENTFPLPGMTHSLKNTFLRFGKTASSGKKINENGFHQQENVFLLKLVLPNFNNGSQHQEKNALNKSILFPLDRKQVSTSLNEELV